MKHPGAIVLIMIGTLCATAVARGEDIYNTTPLPALERLVSQTDVQPGGPDHGHAEVRGKDAQGPVFLHVSKRTHSSGTGASARPTYTYVLRMSKEPDPKRRSSANSIYGSFSLARQFGPVRKDFVNLNTKLQKGLIELKYEGSDERDEPRTKWWLVLDDDGNLLTIMAAGYRLPKNIQWPVPSIYLTASFPPSPVTRFDALYGERR